MPNTNKKTEGQRVPFRPYEVPVGVAIGLPPSSHSHRLVDRVGKRCLESDWTAPWPPLVPHARRPRHGRELCDKRLAWWRSLKRKLTASLFLPLVRCGAQCWELSRHFTRRIKSEKKLTLGYTINTNIDYLLTRHYISEN